MALRSEAAPQAALRVPWIVVAVLALLACVVSSAEPPPEAHTIVESGTLASSAPARLLAEETTPPPDDEGETTTPPPAASMTSLLNSVFKALVGQLQVREWQWVNALIAFLVGAILLANSKFAFKWVVLGAIFCVGMLLTTYEVGANWGMTYRDNISVVVSVEVAAAATFAAFVGYEGLLLLVGGAFGAAAAHTVQRSIADWGFSAVNDNKWFLVILYSVSVAAFMFVIKRKKHDRMLAILGPSVGGALVSSAGSWFITSLAMKQQEFGKFFDQPQDGAWVDFLLLLFTANGKDVGVFAGKKVALAGHEISRDRLCGCVTWFVLFVLGSFIQVKMLNHQVYLQKLRTNKQAGGSTGSNRGSAPPAPFGRGGLRQPLMP